MCNIRGHLLISPTSFEFILQASESTFAWLSAMLVCFSCFPFPKYFFLIMSFHTRTKKIISWSQWFHKLEFKSSVLCFEPNTNISLNRSDKRKASKEFLNCFHHKYKVNLEHKADFSLFVICDMFFKMISNWFKLFDAFKVLSKKKQWSAREVLEL